jgi:LuxR family maltose regulon positive regulatory protein
MTITEAEVDLAAGEPTAAAARIDLITDLAPPFARERLCLARTLFAKGDHLGAQEVLAPLRNPGRVVTIPENEHVESWLLTALAADALRDDNRATQAMGQAVLLAADVDIRRPFVILGEQRLSPLLARLKEVNPELADRVDDLLSYLNSTVDRLPSAALKAPLTDRELMILRFLPTMMTNTEIGSELHLSVNTVKAHLKHIFRKLEVATRRQAAQRGRELGLVDPQRMNEH